MGLYAVKITTPDGQEREARFSFLAQKLIIDRLGCNALEAIQKYDTAALPELLWCCMHDKCGKPPEGLDPVWWAANADPEEGPELYGAFMEMIQKGKVKKKEFAALMRSVLIKTGQEMISGLTPSPLPESVSESAAANSGALPIESTKPTVIDIGNFSESGDSIPA